MDEIKARWIEEFLEKAGKVSINGKRAELGITQEQAVALKRYMELLLEWNRHMNLTTVTEPSEVAARHFLDSAAGIAVLGSENTSGWKMADVGTGAGFPGMVLKVLRPDWKTTLMDALQKRLSFLEQVKQELALADNELVHERAEDAGKKDAFRENFDLIVSRAVASLPVLLELCVPLIKVGGLFLAYKGPGLTEELEASQNALLKLGARVERVESVRIAGEDWEHRIAVIRKEKATAKTYPRRFDKIQKMPL